jgi:hypothetical protein
MHVCTCTCGGCSVVSSKFCFLGFIPIALLVKLLASCTIMVQIAPHKMRVLHLTSSSLYKAGALTFVLFWSFVLYSAHDLLESTVRTAGKSPRRLEVDRNTTIPLPKQAEVEIKLAEVINIDPESSDSGDADADEEEGDDGALKNLLDQIVYPPANRGQASLFREVTDQYEGSLPKSTENKDMYLPVYERIYREAPGVLGFGDHGREMMDSIIKALYADPERETVTLMEVGVWFGSSLARWLQVDPKVRVVGVDPFIAVPTQDRQVKVLKRNEMRQFGKVNFNRGLTLYNMKKEIKEEPTDRTLAIAGFFPQAADFFFDAHHEQKGPDIDIFYLDVGKVNEPQDHIDFVTATITKVFDEFPNVIVSGDDWQHGTHYKLFQDTIRQLAAKYGRTVFLSGNRTWIMAKIKSDTETP